MKPTLKVTKSPTTASHVDQVEISWLFNFDAVTAQIDLEYEDGDDDDEDGVEQAFVNLALGNGDVITAGRYASMLGFEAYEPTGLYQYSTAIHLMEKISAASRIRPRCEIHTHHRYYLLRHLASRPSFW